MRRRGLPSSVRREILRLSRDAATSLHRLVALLPASSMPTFYSDHPGSFTPVDEAKRIRTTLDLGSGPLCWVSDVLERLGVVVIYGAGTAEAGVTLVSGLTRPVIVAFGKAEAAASLRHGLLCELGFWLAGVTTRAAPKLFAARTFADELLVPLKGLSYLILSGRSQISRAELIAVAQYFMAPVDAVERQCERLDVKLRKDGRGDGASSPGWSAPYEPRPSYFHLLAAQVQAADSSWPDEAFQ